MNIIFILELSQFFMPVVAVKLYALIFQERERIEKSGYQSVKKHFDESKPGLQGKCLECNHQPLIEQEKNN